MVVSVSVIIPTFKEAQNIPPLLTRLKEVLAGAGLDFEIWLMDDASRDGSAEAVQAFADSRFRFVERTDDFGLSQAVVDGMHRATGDVLVVMDADLSHPPEVIPNMLAHFEGGASFVLGSRYAPGGSTDDDWGLFRWLNSKVATLLCRPLVRVSDPMAGFFALPRSMFERVRKHLDPVGYKIGLELMVKAKVSEVTELPIHFSDRLHGQSKLTFKQQLLYLEHLRRLYLYYFGGLGLLAHFLGVGLLGVGVNIGLVTLASTVGFTARWASALGIGASVLSNFFLHRHGTFRASKEGPALGQLSRYALVTSFTASINWWVVQWAHVQMPSAPLQWASLIGIVAGTALNFILAKYVVFRVHATKRLDAATS